MQSRGRQKLVEICIWSVAHQTNNKWTVMIDWLIDWWFIATEYSEFTPDAPELLADGTVGTRSSWKERRYPPSFALGRLFVITAEKTSQFTAHAVSAGLITVTSSVGLFLNMSPSYLHQLLSSRLIPATVTAVFYVWNRSRSASVM